MVIDMCIYVCVVNNFSGTSIDLNPILVLMSLTFDFPQISSLIGAARTLNGPRYEKKNLSGFFCEY